MRDESVPSVGPVRILKVRTKEHLRRFVEMIYPLRGEEQLWVPPPRKEQYALLDRDDHPFHEHAHCEYFLALRGARVVGRVAMIENHAHNAFHSERAGHFGMIEAENDPDVFGALAALGRKWCRARGLTVLRGPCSFSTNEECGLLVEGFDCEPAILTSFTPAYYKKRIEEAGFKKSKDLLSYHCDRAAFEDRIPRMAERLSKKHAERGLELTIRSLEMSRFDSEVDRIKEVYNSAWEKNWGFVPMTDAEIARMAKDLKPVIAPFMVVFAEVAGKPVGFALGLPDFNVVLRHLNGNLGPMEILKFLLLKKSIHRFRLMGMGVVEAYRARGIETMLIAQLAKNCLERGYTEAELGWVLEDNKLMHRGVLAVGARVSRIHRMYEIAC